MRFFYTFRTAFEGLRRNRSRSALTVLGIVIGIAAVMLVMSIGSSAQNLILSQIQGLGTRTIAVIPGREPSGPSDVTQLFSDSLKARDLDLLRRKENVPELKTIMPIVFGSESVSFEGETYRATVFGGTELATEIFDLAPEAGEFISDEDVRSRADVVVIGSKVKEELFGDSEAVGKRVRVKDRSLRVIGVLPTKGQVSFFNFDEAVFAPYTTAQQFIFGIKYFHRFIVEAESEGAIDRTVEDLKATLRESHGITDPDKDDFFVQTQADLASRLSIITNVLTLFLASVAAISLVVGGIGIMNIMLVSVTERTREIGLRKAIGARRKDILYQFLLEAILLTGTGGVIGILVGSALSFVAALLISQFVGLALSFAFPVFAAFLGLGVAALVGLIFGIYPARKAAEKSPIEALRFE